MINLDLCNVSFVSSGKTFVSGTGYRRFEPREPQHYYWPIQKIRKLTHWTRNIAFKPLSDWSLFVGLCGPSPVKRFRGSKATIFGMKFLFFVVVGLAPLASWWDHTQIDGICASFDYLFLILSYSALQTTDVSSSSVPAYAFSLNVNFPTKLFTVQETRNPAIT